MNIWAVPGQDGYYTPPGFSRSYAYFSAHTNELCDLLNQYFRPYEDEIITPDDLNIKEISWKYESSVVNPGGSLEDY